MGLSKGGIHYVKEIFQLSFMVFRNDIKRGFESYINSISIRIGTVEDCVVAIWTSNEAVSCIC